MTARLTLQEAAESVRANLLVGRNTAATTLKRILQDVCLETLAVACDDLEPQAIEKFVEYLGFDSSIEFDVYHLLGGDTPVKVKRKDGCLMRLGDL